MYIIIIFRVGRNGMRDIIITCVHVAIKTIERLRVTYVLTVNLIILIIRGMRDHDYD